MEKPIKLLWTGGFDSTFRLLHILVVEKKYVQPYYVVDSTRKSTMYELKAMEIIRGNVINKFPETKNLILPSIIHLKTDILPNPKLNKYYNNIKSAFHIPPQHEWLTVFAHQFGIEDLEYCGEKIEPIPDFENHYRSILLPELEGKWHDCKLRNKVTNANNLLFSCFRFPVLHLTKNDMKSLSELYNFNDIMRDTWFCHRPNSRGRLCGICVPCTVRLDSGLETHIPFSKMRFVEQAWFSLKNKLRSTGPIKKLWDVYKQTKKTITLE